MIKKYNSIQTDSHILLCIVMLLLTIGTLFIYSSSSVYALEQCGSTHYFLKKQLIGIVIGMGAFTIALLMPLAFIQKLSPFFFISSCGLTALSLLPSFALHVHGSSRWIRYGHFSFQPSELLKVGLLLYTAFFLDKKINTSPRAITDSLYSFIALIIILIIPSIILLKQPDFGFTVTLVGTILMTCLITQFQTKRIVMSMIGIIPIAIGLIVVRPYRIKRILTFLNPWHDPQGTGFQIIQSLIAIGSGGLWGIGIGQSRQKFFYLPMQHTDFIFSIIAEETGFMGILLLLVLYILFLYYGLRIACTIQNHYSRYFIVSFTLLISLQAIINIAVTTGLVPTKGIGLPFISYGNTNLVANLCMVGIVMNMVREDHIKKRTLII